MTDGVKQFLLAYFELRWHEAFSLALESGDHARLDTLKQQAIGVGSVVTSCYARALYHTMTEMTPEDWENAFTAVCETIAGKRP